MLFNQLVLTQQSFEVLVNTPENEGFVFTFEDFNSDIITVGGGNSDFGLYEGYPLILKINKWGGIIINKTFPKIDTIYSFKYGFQKANGNYFIMGTLTDTVLPNDFNITYLCELDTEFELVWEKMHPIPEVYNNHYIINFLISPDSNIILQGRMDSSIYSYNDLLFFAKLDMDGNLLDFVQPENWKDYGVYGDLMFKPDSSGFYLIGDVNINYIPKDWIEFDNDLNMINYGEIEDWMSYMNTPLSVKWLTNGNMIIANRSSGITVPSTQDLEVRIVDQDFNMVKDTIIYYDEYVYIPVNKGLGFTDENNIWIATFQGSPTFLPGTEVFRFHIFDANLNLKGVKAYGCDTRYWFYDMIITSDGGCLITGMVPDYEGSWNNDGYIIKVMPQDILTYAEETLVKNDRDVFVYPNPFSNRLKIETIRENLEILIYDHFGKLVLSKKITDIPYSTFSTGHLHTGFYFYTIKSNNSVIQSGKLLKL